MKKTMHSNNFIDLTGKKFGRLTVIKYSHKDYNRKTFWKCICYCGNNAVVYSQKLKTGHTKSCGCLNKEAITKHGDTGTKLFERWQSMIKRCCYNKYYKDIKVCKRWLEYRNFKKDMLDSFLLHHLKNNYYNTTLDRINPFGNYCKSNCRWATRKEQCNNFRKQYGKERS